MTTAPWQNTLRSLLQPEFAVAVKGIRRGIERESLRIQNDARLASTRHPAAFGSPLTHSWITTDFAEALLEFITPVGTEARETLDIMTDIHRHAYRHLDQELLWPVSMPCTIDGENTIELANYGNSNPGRLKAIYRQGLKNRYGAMMQTIAGVHYNFSMPESFWPALQKVKADRCPLQDFISASYFGLIRNFLRLGWVIPFLFGASPAVDSSFYNHVHRTILLKSLGRHSYYLPYATSLRMSKLGYNTQEQEKLAISYNSLSKFVRDLRRATSLPSPVFAEIGVKLHGEYQQLNANTLQGESELYAPIRPKRVTREGETLSNALQERGVEYVEVRSLDVNPYAEAGIDLQQVYFLDVFLTYCLLKDSPELSQEQLDTTRQNQNRVATCGRDLSLQLIDDNKPRFLHSWADEMFTDMTGVANLLDMPTGEGKFQAALNHQRRKLSSPSLTPSARMLREMNEKGLEANELALNLAVQHRLKLINTDYTVIETDQFTLEADNSRQKQQVLEKDVNVSFEDFLRLEHDGFSPASAASST